VSEVTSSQNVNRSNNVTGGGVDYDSGPYTVTFTAGQTSASFKLPINDDNVLENTEYFGLSIIFQSLPTSVNAIPSQATVFIAGNVGKHLKYSKFMTRSAKISTILCFTT